MDNKIEHCMDDEKELQVWTIRNIYTSCRGCIAKLQFDDDL